MSNHIRGLACCQNWDAVSREESHIAPSPEPVVCTVQVSLAMSPSREQILDLEEFNSRSSWRCLRMLQQRRSVGMLKR